MSEKAAGLAASLPVVYSTRGFPLNIKCEFLGNSNGCEGDTSSVNSYAYKDYCVTMLDKIDGAFRTDADMPMRRIRNFDCMYPGAVKSTDAWHDRVPGMPVLRSDRARSSPRRIHPHRGVRSRVLDGPHRRGEPGVLPPDVPHEIEKHDVGAQ
jgi:hypothetical protein